MQRRAAAKGAVRAEPWVAMAVEFSRRWCPESSAARAEAKLGAEPISTPAAMGRSPRRARAHRGVIASCKVTLGWRNHEDGTQQCYEEKKRRVASLRRTLQRSNCLKRSGLT